MALPLPSRPSDEHDEIRDMAVRLDTPDDLDPLMDRIGDARFVLLGEASHGTSEYYRWRTEISHRLITERDFSFVAVEGDWPDCFAVNRWVKGRLTPGSSPREILEVFRRWPTWMWANVEVAEFLEWLRRHNDDAGTEVGFYGLDVYSLWESLRRVVSYLSAQRPDAVAAARDAFRCFEPYHEEPQRYAWATRMIPDDCEEEVIELLAEMRRTPHLTDADPEADFDARQNAHAVAGAERYYRTMVRADEKSWNVRDLHMSDTLDRLMSHHGPVAKAIVWEHNTHVGDARATDMAAAGMVNVGQVVRERHGPEDVVLVGFGSHHGHVIAADAWDARMQRLTVPSARQGSHEDLLHTAAPEQALFVFPDDRDTPWLAARRGHRAIGVVYHPESDAFGNWVPTEMGRRYDAFCFFDETDSLHPFDLEPVAEGAPETYPWST